MLRVLGGVADELGASAVAITESADGFRFSAETPTGRIEQLLTYSRLL
jgi:hypothetical protein